MFQQALTASCICSVLLLGWLVKNPSRNSYEVNQPPVANDDSYTVHGFMSPLTPGITANDSDPEGGPLFVTQIITPVQHGRLNNIGQNAFSYFPNLGFTGEDSFAYQVCDTQAGCSSGRVTLNVVNQPPAAVADAFTVHGNTTLGNLMANDSDAEGDSFAIVTLVTFPQHGTLMGLTEPGVFNYRPEPHFLGTDSFSYRICDQYGACSTGAVTLSVVNNAPLAQGETYTIRGVTKIGSFLANDQDPDPGDQITFVQTSGASHGTVFGAPEPGFATYHPNAGFSGVDSFTYKVCDQLLLCSEPATVTLLVLPNDGAEELGEACPNRRVGRPVNVTNGNMYLRQRDYSLPGVGPSINLERTYNSQSNRFGIFGRGWSTQYDETLVIYNPSVVRLFEADGKATHFLRGVDGILWPVEGDFHGLLTQNIDLTFLLTYKNGEMHHFSAGGKLLSLTDRNGNRTTLNYDANERLVGITDPVGRTLHLISDSDGRVIELLDAMGSIATYGYGVNHELLNVNYPDGSRFSFSYVNSPQLLLAVVTDALGNVIESHSYDAQGRALTSAKHENVELLTLVYVNPNQTDVVDALGHTTSYFFSTDRARDVVTSVRGMCNCGSDSQDQSWTYDEQLNVLTYTNARGLITSYTYDSEGNQLTATDNLGTVMTTYNEFGQVVTTRDVLGNIARYTYNNFGNLIAFDDPLDNVTSFTYDASGRLLTVTDARQSVTRYSYDSTGNLIEFQDALGNLRNFTYDGRGRLLSARDPLNNITDYNYDPLGRLTKIIRPDHSSVTLGYDLAGRRTAIIDARGNPTTYSYDGAYRLRSQTDALGNIRTYDYDLNSNLTATTDELGRRTDFEYDEFRRLTKVIFPQASADSGRLFESLEYDELGNVTGRTDRAGRRTTFEYDIANRVIKVVDPSLQATQFEYDERSQVVALIDALGQRYGFAYDSLGRLVDFQQGELTRSYTYDTVGNRIQRKDFNNQVTSYRYDRLNRLRRITYPDLSTVIYRYDPASRLRAAINQHGGINFEYDNRNRLLSTRDTLGRTVNYTYDANGNRLSMALGATVDATYEYDSVNRLFRIIEAAGGKVNSFSYDPAGNLTLRVLGNAVSTSYTYDGLNRLTHLRHFKGGNVLADHRYTYDDVDNLVQDTEPNSDNLYAYDALDRLIASLSGAGSEAYLYDSVGNRTSSHLSSSYSYQPFNQLATSTKAQINYDANGNVISKTDIAGVVHYTWDFENRLVRVTSASGQTVAYKYDALGRRIERASSTGAVTSFVYDGLDVIKDLNSDGTVLNYLNGPGVDNKLRQRGSGDSFYYLKDQRGSTRMLTDNKARLIERLSYDSFGNLLRSSGGSAGSVNTRYDFTGRERDPLTGLIYYRTRWYDPQLGRFISEDPMGLGGGINQYTYVSNNPLTRRDPLGLYEIDVHYYLTYYLAIKTGCFSHEEAADIANSAQAVDENESSKPGLGASARQRQVNALYHALQSGSHQPYLEFHWLIATQGSNGSLQGLGAYLHYLQDTFSHAGFTDPLCGHGCLDWHHPDKTDSDVEKTVRMAVATWHSLQKFAREKKCGCQGTSWTDASWSVVRVFAKLSGGPDFRSINSRELEAKRRVLNVPLRF